MILIDQLLRNQRDFTYSGYHPRYFFAEVKAAQTGLIQRSLLYDTVKWLVWSISSKFLFLRRKNKHLNLTYPLYDRITSKYLKNNCDILFGWLQVSLTSIREVKKRTGAITILDCPIPHILVWQRLLKEERCITKGSKVNSLFSEVMVDRILLEIEEADFISIPSIFVRKTFIESGVPESKLIFNSYGIDTDFFTPSQKVRFGKLIILFVGSVEIRKGLHYLLEAVKGFDSNEVELRVVGNISGDFDFLCKKYKNAQNVIWLGQLDRQQTADEMRRSDIMVMPSILEGLSLTILECMSCGTPVISSEHAGGLDVIEDGVNGFIVPIRNAEAIRKKINWCLVNVEKLENMGRLARNKILSYYRKENYANRFVNLVLSKKYEEELAKSDSKRR